MEEKYYADDEDAFDMAKYFVPKKDKLEKKEEKDKADNEETKKEVEK